MTAENEFGSGISTETQNACKISEAPGIPDNIKVGSITDTSAVISWLKPAHDGGSVITGYLVEKTIGDIEDWAVCETTKELHTRCDNLVTGKMYTFRVRAQVCSFAIHN